MSKCSIDKELPPVVLPRHWLVAEPTRLLDRVEPLVEETLLPVYKTLAGSLKLRYEAVESDCEKVYAHKKRKFKSFFKQSKATHETCPKDLCCINLRRNSPQNWAHAFTNHLPAALLIADLLELSPDELCVVLPGGTPKKIVQLFELIGFEVLATDGTVTGRFCEYDIKPWRSIRGLRCEVLRKMLSDSPIRDKLLSASSGKPKLFISRKDARKVANEQQVEAYLAQQGYEKIYPEEYDLIDQIGMIAQAEEIVAVHGAGLGPLVFKSIVDRPYKLLELFSPAHVTNVYRLVAHQTGGQWIGVRGNVWSSLVSKNAKFFDNMQDFEVSLEALKRAREIQSSGQTDLPQQ